MQNIDSFDFNILKNNNFYFLNLPVEISVFIENNKLNTKNKNPVCIDYRSDLFSFTFRYQKFSIGTFLKTLENDALFDYLKLDFINSTFLITDLSKIGLYCFFILEITKEEDTILIDLDGFSDSSKCLCFEFLKKISKAYINKTFIASTRGDKFNISIVNKEDKLSKFVDDIDDLSDEKDFIKGFTNYDND